MEQAVIVSAARTPVGSFGGGLKTVPAVELGCVAAREAVRRAGVAPELIEEVIFGNVLQGGNRPNVARQVSVHSGIPVGASAMTVNKLCGSALKAVALAAQSIQTGENKVVLAGGTESMSTSPYLLPSERWGAKMGSGKTLDSMLYDALEDAFDGQHMGTTAETVAARMGITREEQDAFAAGSQNRAEAAIKEGRFAEEIVPVPVPQRKGDSLLFDTDEFPRFGATAEGLAALRPAFAKEGTVTAGNASGINDGAAALVLMGKTKAEEMGIPWLASVEGYATAGVAPEVMGLGPVESTRKLMKKLGGGHRALRPCGTQRGLRRPVPGRHKGTGPRQRHHQRERRGHRHRSPHRVHRGAHPHHPALRNETPGPLKRPCGHVHRRRPGHLHGREDESELVKGRDVMRVPAPAGFREMLREVFTDGFMARHTRVQTFEEFRFSSAVFVNWEADPMVYRKSLLDGFVRETSLFESWDAMVRRAVAEYRESSPV